MKKPILLFLLTILLLLGGWFGAGELLQKRGYKGTGDFLGQVFTNYPKGMDAHPAQLSIVLDEVDHQHLVNVVEAARERGVIMPEGNDYVPARVEWEGHQFKAKVRIKGKLTDHVDGKKWSLRVLSRQGGGFMGMQRFSIQHPGTRNYLYEWLYHRIMAREGVIALKYGLVEVTLNGEDRGLYAYEEHFGPELLQHNDRLEGPIVRFDPGLYWIQRLNEMQGNRAYEPYAQYQAAAVDPFGTGDLVKDPKSMALFQDALHVMESFRRGEMPASQAFDADRIGRRHAIIDLIGGHHSMDWSDVKFYFDPILKHFEPVAYESFSVHPLKVLAGSHRYDGSQRSTRELHDALFSDEQVFRAYIRHLERVAAQGFLDTLFTDLGHELDSISAILFTEFPYKELDRSLYYKNQQTIQRMLDMPAGAHAYVQHVTADSVKLVFVPVSDLPIEIHSIAQSGNEVKLSKPVILPARPSGKPGEPLDIMVLKDKEWSEDLKKLKFEWSVLGASKRKRTEMLPYAFAWEDNDHSSVKHALDLSSVDFLHLDKGTNTISIAPGKHTIDRDLVFPEGTLVTATVPLRIQLKDGARLVFHSPVRFKGNEELPIIIESDSSGGSIEFLAEKGRSILEHVHFKGLGNGAQQGIAMYRTNVEIKDCQFMDINSHTSLLVALSNVTISGCTFNGGGDQLRSEIAILDLRNCTFIQAHDDAITIAGGQADFQNVRIEGALGLGLKLIAKAQMTATNVQVKNVKKAFEARTGSRAQVTDLSVHDAAIGVEVDGAEIMEGPVEVVIKNYVTSAVEIPEQCGVGSKLIIDGKEVPARSKKGT